MEKTTSGIQSVERALHILETLSACSSGCSVTDISKTTGLNKSTVFRMLQTLRSGGYVYQEKETEYYHIGYKILELSSNILDSLDIRQIAHATLEKCCTNTGEIVHLCILDGTACVYIDKIENEQRAIRMNSKIGKHVPFYVSSAGKCLVAWMPEKEKNELMSKIQFERFTETTIDNCNDLTQELDDVRASCYALDLMEVQENVLCIAAPIFNAKDSVIAAVSISVGAWNLSKELYECMKKEVHMAAKTVSRYLGFNDYPEKTKENPKEEKLLEKYLI